MITKEDISKRLSEAITRSGLTRKEVAEKIGVSQPTVSHYVSGSKMPSLETFANLCRALDLDANDVLCVGDLNLKRQSPARRHFTRPRGIFINNNNFLSYSLTKKFSIVIRLALTPRCKPYNSRLS